MNEDDTFNRLRRSHWRDACTAYNMAMFECDGTEAEQMAAGNDALIANGWTADELVAFLIKMEQDESNG